VRKGKKTPENEMGVCFHTASTHSSHTLRQVTSLGNRIHTRRR